MLKHSLSFDEFYRVSHSKDWKVILLRRGYRFWFLLIFWVLHVHEICPFMTNLSVFIFFMLPALYKMISKTSEFFFGKKSLNVPNVKLLSIFFFNIFGFSMPFWQEWYLALYMLTAIFFEGEAISTPTKSPNPTFLSQGGLASTQ